MLDQETSPSCSRNMNDRILKCRYSKFRPTLTGKLCKKRATEMCIRPPTIHLPAICPKLLLIDTGQRRSLVNIDSQHFEIQGITQTYLPESHKKKYSERIRTHNPWVRLRVIPNFSNHTNISSYKLNSINFYYQFVDFISLQKHEMD